MTNREKVKTSKNERERERERERETETERKNDTNTCITNRKKMIGYSAAYVFKLKEH